MLSERHEQIIHSGALQARIEQLALTHALVVPGAESLCVGCDEDEHEELEALLQFREDVISETSALVWEHSGGFISEDYFEQYQYERQCDIYSKEIVDSPYWDDDQFTDDQRDEFTELDFGGVTYWVDREV